MSLPQSFASQHLMAPSSEGVMRCCEFFLKRNIPSAAKTDANPSQSKLSSANIDSLTSFSALFRDDQSRVGVIVRKDFAVGLAVLCHGVRTILTHADTVTVARYGEGKAVLRLAYLKRR